MYKKSLTTIKSIILISNTFNVFVLVAFCKLFHQNLCVSVFHTKIDIKFISISEILNNDGILIRKI